jgi:hypothetical protein
MTWISTESRQHLAEGDQELVLQLADEIEQARQLSLKLPAVLHVMRDGMSGQPQAPRRGSGDGPSAWCWTHERTTVECDREGLLCTGELLAGPSDPTGNAAVGGDRAAGDYRRLRREVEQLQVLLSRMVKTTAPYAVEHLTSEILVPTAGDDWCRSCWKDNKYCEPVSRRPNGSAWYKGLCRWCGQASKELGGEPPTWLVERRHRGDRVTAGMMERARLEIHARGKKKGKRTS